MLFLFFKEDHGIILDSIHGVQELNATSTIKYLWRESQSPSFGCSIFLQTIFIEEDEAVAACNGIGVISLIAVFFQQKYLFFCRISQKSNDNL